MINHFVQFIFAVSLAIATSAAAQETAPAKPVPAKTAKVVAAKITRVLSPGESADAAKAVAPLVDQPMTIDQSAVAIYEKTVAVARALKAIQLTTQVTLAGRDSGMFPPDFLDPTSSIWDLEETEGSPCKRMRIEMIKNITPVRVITFDWTHSLLASPQTKKYVFEEDGTNWFGILKSAGSAVPQWVFDFRAVESEPSKVTAAAIIGEETIDGQLCDIVRISNSIDLGSPDEEGEENSIMMTTTYTFSAARSDSFPRKFSKSLMVNGESDMASLLVTYQYSNVKLDPTLDASMFATAPPDGYSKAEKLDQAKVVQQSQPQLKAKVGEKALDFSLVGIDGAQFSLEGLKGKVILLDFWATWCGPCKQVMPTIQKIADDYKDKDVAVFGVNTWERGEGAAKKYMESKGFTYSCLLAGDELATSYGVTGIPTLLVIGKDGVIVLVEVGMASDGGLALRTAIDAALAK